MMDITVCLCRGMAACLCRQTKNENVRFSRRFQKNSFHKRAIS